MKQILLVGNPNCGKTTLFNALTGDKQRVGNWPGVTVEKKTGSFTHDGQQFSLTDLPGIYSLSSTGRGLSQDEHIAANAIASLPCDLIVNVIDACHLERHLYVTSQVLELGKPVIVAINMMDIAQMRGINLDIDALSKQLGCPVIAIQAHKKIGLDALRAAIGQANAMASPLCLSLNPEIAQLLLVKQAHLQAHEGMSLAMARYHALRTLEGENSDEGYDILLADARYQKIHHIVTAIQSKHSDASEHFTAKVDKIVLHRVWGLPIFFAIMYTMFLFAINVGGAFQDFFELSANALLVEAPRALLHHLQAPNWLITLLANGLGLGITTTLTFIPVIAALFFFLSALEISGYMARAAFVVDKVMRLLGLPGKSFVPMIVGFGCNVPAIMAARTLDSERDRILTILMSPFMSCSARLAIYAVFVAAFFPKSGQNVVFCLYVLGIVMAVLTGFLLRKTALDGATSPLILELPAYHKPSLSRLFRETNLRLRFFISRALRLIVPVCILLSVLNTQIGNVSLLSLLGQSLTPLFSPMGISPDNWPATVGLLTGMLAKEVVVGTLNTLYTGAGHSSTAFDIGASLLAALWSIPQNLAALGQALINPILASAPVEKLSRPMMTIMSQRFDGQAGAFAYLLFILLYIPCVSTMAVIRQEANRQWMWFSIIWSFLLAYTSAVTFYQLARFFEHPQQSLLWVMISITLVALFIGLLRYRGFNWGGQDAVTNS